MSLELQLDRVRLPIPIDFPTRFKGKKAVKKRSQLSRFLNWLLFATKSSGLLLARDLGVHEATVYRLMKDKGSDERSFIVLASALTEITGVEFTFEWVKQMADEHEGTSWHEAAELVQATYMEQVKS